MNYIRKINRKKWLTVLAALFYVTAANAQQQSMTLQQCIDYAMQNKPQVQNAVYDEESAKYKVREIVGLGLPQISSSFDVKNFLDIPTSLVPADFFGGPPGTFAAVQFGTQYNATAGLSASQLVFSSDYLVGVQATKVFLELTKVNTKRTKIEAAQMIAKAYYTVLINDERMKLLNANVERIKKLMDDTKVLNDNGFVEKIDLDRVTVAYNNLMVEKQKIEQLLQLGYSLLKYQMSMDQSATLTLTDKLDAVTFNPQLNDGKFDYNNRVEYSLMQLQYKSSILYNKKDKMSYLPSVVLYGSLSANAMRNEFDIFDTSKGWYPTTLIGLTVNLPILTGGQRHYRTQQSKVNMLKSQNDLKFMQQSIDLEIVSVKITLDNASKTLEMQKQNILLAENVYKTAKIKYEQGVGSNIEVMTAETALKEAQTNYYNALYEALIAKIDYDKAMGTLVK
jgi:outer membrane protein TolC